MRERLVERLGARMQTYEDLVQVLPEQALASELPVPSNTVGAQMWCVVGARESYARAIRAGDWEGFSCSLTAEGAHRSADVLACLRASSSAVLDAARDIEWAPRRDDLLVDLLEHEAQHQGQLIRYVYGLGYEFPDSWKQRWALS